MQHARERERERDMKNACNILVKQIKVRDHLQDLPVDKGITLRRNIVKLGMWMCTGFT
jgi:hypothetical protein